jgi:hypothetical protein
VAGSRVRSASASVLAYVAERSAASDLTVIRAVGVESEIEFAFAGLEPM